VEEITVTGGTSSSKALFSGFLLDGRIDISTICALVHPRKVSTTKSLSVST
jgi:hypothetical protein